MLAENFEDCFVLPDHLVTSVVSHELYPLWEKPLVLQSLCVGAAVWPAEALKTLEGNEEWCMFAHLCQPPLLTRTKRSKRDLVTWALDHKRVTEWKQRVSEALSAAAL